MNHFEMVREFHVAFGVPMPSEPTIPLRSTVELRLNLIREEAEELHAGLVNQDIVEIADALADLRYVIDGCALVCGLDVPISRCGPPDAPNYPRIFPFDVCSVWLAELDKRIFSLSMSFVGGSISGVRDWLHELTLDIEHIAKMHGIDLDACSAEVHRSNMTKLDADGKVLRRADGKVIKSDLYEPPNLRKVLGVE